jgi:hypothetical protein
LVRSSGKPTSMSDQTKPAPNAPGVPTYPNKTTGSEAAAAVRKEANDWSEQTRAKLFEDGMRIIYGGSCPSTAKVRS